jgi:predicted YcjX-like family ATPase
LAFDPLNELLGTARALRALVLGAPQQTVRLAVTGLSRAGKTVFATALSANLLALPRDPRRLAKLPAAAEGRIAAVREATPADGGAQNFPLADALAALAGAASWPRPTTRLSGLALEIEIESPQSAWLERELGATRRAVRLEIIDYPGEWLLDLPLLDRSFEEWSQRELLRAEEPGRAALARPWRAALGEIDPAAPAREAATEPVVAAFRAYLMACREAGLVALTPGRFLNPDQWDGMAFMQFCPLPKGLAAPMPGSIAAVMRARHAEYLARTRSEFLEPYLSRFDAQIVLVDLFGALAAGAASFSEVEEALAGITRAMRPDAGWLSLLGLGRAAPVVYAATKADYVPASQRGQLAALLKHLVGEEAKVTTVAAIRCTEDVVVTDRGRPQEAVEGLVEAPAGASPTREAFWFAGGVPVERPTDSWFDHRYAVPVFSPPAFDPDRGLRHANLDGVLALTLPELFA